MLAMYCKRETWRNKQQASCAQQKQQRSTTGLGNPIHTCDAVSNSLANGEIDAQAYSSVRGKWMQIKSVDRRPDRRHLLAFVSLG